MIGTESVLITYELFITLIHIQFINHNSLALAQSVRRALSSKLGGSGFKSQTGTVGGKVTSFELNPVTKVK